MATDLASDPVSSLRAAALSTLKSKRRKPAAERPNPIPERPPPPKEAFQLDYGQDELSRDVSMADTTVSPESSYAKPTKSGSEASPSQGLYREEGEISDEEESAVEQASTSEPPPSNRVYSSPKTMSPEPREVAEARQLLQLSTTRESSISVSGPSRLSEKQKSPATLSYNPVPLTMTITSLGPQGVRPGVTLSQNEYDAVKNVVLDLLGWGVPPSHFIECGVSREALFYVFSELNLALPDGFDSSGLLPFTPEMFAQHQQSAIVGPPQTPEKRLLDLSPAPSPLTAEPSITDVAMSPTDGPSASLNDIERQRRLQLQLRARKAAQASRKLQHSSSTDSGSGTSLEPQNSPPIARPDVDDFLSSIGPQLVDPPSAIEPSSSEATNSKMDEDTSWIRSPYSDPPPQSTASPKPASPIIPEPPPQSADSVKTSVPSGALSVTSESAMPLESPIEAEPFLPPPASAPISSNGYSATRRGVKRAVATDFDFDQPAPRRNGSMPQPPSKQAKTVFVSIASRRCVIDLSDSEEEDDEPTRYPPLPPVPEQQPWNRRDRKIKASTYPSPASSKPMTPVGGLGSPAILLQKELEIRKMRELIAQREEETRLKKLAAKAAVNPDPPSPPAEHAMEVVAQPQPVRLQMEDPDVEMSSSTTPIEVDDEVGKQRVEISSRRCSESASPPAEISEASLPITWGVTNSPIDSLSEAQNTPANPEPVTPVDIGQDPIFSAVDVDILPSSSTQINETPGIRASVLPKQDSRRSPSAQQASPQPSSTDQQPTSETSEFITYRSPFASYPLMWGHTSTPSELHRISLSTLAPHTPSHTLHSRPSIDDTPSPVSLIPDLRPLRWLTLSKHLDTSKRLCQFEVPGGGTCRDDKCEDVHLSKSWSVEPSDRETADYLFSLLSDDWRSTYQVFSSIKILDALRSVQNLPGNDSMDLQERVGTTLTMLMSSPTT